MSRSVGERIKEGEQGSHMARRYGAGSIKFTIEIFFETEMLETKIHDTILLSLIFEGNQGTEILG